ncbi:hypothetical protein BJ322DRAFT_1061274 [Thelephora terrestris]|jgi:hypothetical protein|uniref:BTB domain-containing protein n=1 Tax=Thelephora terrestris TaxID=56493 RepID=A0A9P6HDT5_9AGAM|nr:hypothetical protein BJ322DRAFT_1061274 [Thelephora terrestris]
MSSEKAYDFDDADIVLRTPRSRGFRVHRSVISVASPVLRSLVAEAPKVSSEDEEKGDLPEINVEDAPEDLDLLLHLIYPITPPPRFEDLDALSRAFTILQKYQVEGAQGLLKPVLVSPSFLASDPVRVYALACRLGFKEEAEVAASLAATTDFTTAIRAEDLRKMSGIDYHRLVVLSKERLKKSKSDIFSFPLQCANCPQAFYDLLRKKLADKLITDEGGKFYDAMECLEMCFTLSKECGNYACGGVGGNLHFEKFVFALVKELQKTPAYIY